ncbi:tail fiber assembly protein [Dickeya sp. CFBP 2040]|uniref:tail fiber assembly protein n=1 Tax=Dickeya sp. CFBP 2040 TaxID=2718531 RepID=UPI0014473802|nr:tail fiber assembly protein [Dickeya sp. CFBP 2040]NKI73009.1 tail fiber assembly protein [Dickeya sp. CFBP 2040]
MKKINSVYSPSQNVIYPAQLYADYERAGTWPSDGIEIGDDDAVRFSPVNQPVGKMLGYVEGGLIWVDEPAPSQMQLIREAEARRQLLLSTANDLTADWRTELALDIIADGDKAKLVEWMQYIKAVKAVDISTAPNVSWPEKPNM